MSEILNEHGQVATPEIPELPAEFFFSLRADAEGITELRFTKQVEPLFGTLLTALDYVNNTFDQPYPTLGDFLRSLAETADQIEAAHAAQAVNQGAGNDQIPTPSTEEVPTN